MAEEALTLARQTGDAATEAYALRPHDVPVG